MADGVWKGVYPKVFGHSKQLSLNKFFDPSTQREKVATEESHNPKGSQKGGKRRISGGRG